MIDLAYAKSTRKMRIYGRRQARSVANAGCFAGYGPERAVVEMSFLENAKVEVPYTGSGRTGNNCPNMLKE